jgi:hypothetical protein
MLLTRKLPPFQRSLMLPPLDIEQMHPLALPTSSANNVHPTPKRIRWLLFRQSVPQCFRLPTPLIEPDGPVSGIGL